MWMTKVGALCVTARDEASGPGSWAEGSLNGRMVRWLESMMSLRSRLSVVYSVLTRRFFWHSTSGPEEDEARLS